jgi:hypothetical protein
MVTNNALGLVTNTLDSRTNYLTTHTLDLEANYLVTNKSLGFAWQLIIKLYLAQQLTV